MPRRVRIGLECTGTCLIQVARSAIRAPRPRSGRAVRRKHLIKVGHADLPNPSRGAGVIFARPLWLRISAPSEGVLESGDFPPPPWSRFMFERLNAFRLIGCKPFDLTSPRRPSSPLIKATSLRCRGSLDQSCIPPVLRE